MLKKMLTITALISILTSASSYAEILQDTTRINGRYVFRTYDTITFTLCYSFGTSYSSQPACRNLDLFYTREALTTEIRTNNEKEISLKAKEKK